MTPLRHRLLCGAFLLAAGLPGAAFAADPAAGHFIVDLRLRSESVTQDGFARDAEALTLRGRIGYETAVWNGFRLLVEGEGVAPLIEDYNSTTNGQTMFPTVTDPEGAEINRLQISWTGAKGDVVVGRQRLVLGNARFIGNVGFRQNEQTFDAVKAAFKPTNDLTLTFAYVDRVHRIFGDDSPQGEWDADAKLFQADYKTSIGQLSGYAFLMAFDNAPAQSNATWGLRLTGARPIGGGRSFTYEAEYARQTDYRNSPVAFDLAYMALSGGLKTDRHWISLGMERLEGDGVRGFTTPLATLHAFQGWADAFLATPRDGIRDLNLRAGGTVKVGPGGRPVKLAAAFHDFADDGGDVGYGQEFDLLVSTPLTKSLTAEFKAASFDSERPAFADRSKVWVTLEYRF